jgi:predicted secreted protein
VFTDKRSRKIVLAAHCVLNQNAKIDQCAHYPGAIQEVTQLLLDAGLGIVQMPCPELLYLGLDRQADPGAPATVASEDTRVARRMRETPASVLCGELAGRLVLQVLDYRKNGFEVAGIIGINGSPTCGVEANWAEDEEEPGPGVFIRRLDEQLRANGMRVSLRGIKALEPQCALAAVNELLNPSAGQSGDA